MVIDSQEDLFGMTMQRYAFGEHIRRADIKFAMLPYFKRREAALIVPKGFVIRCPAVRLLTIDSVQNFDFAMKITGCKDPLNANYFNIYASVASYPRGATFSPGSSEARAAKKKSWETEHYTLMMGYDFVIDIDGEFSDFKDTRYSAMRIASRLARLRCPHYLRYSGKGFHIIIPFQYMRDAMPPEHCSFDPNQKKNIYLYFSSIAKLISDQDSEMVDTSIYDSRRVLKVPWSCVMYLEGTYIARPLLSIEDLSELTLASQTYSAWRYKSIPRIPEPLLCEGGDAKGLIGWFDEKRKKGKKRGVKDEEKEVKESNH